MKRRLFRVLATLMLMALPLAAQETGVEKATPPAATVSAAPTYAVIPLKGEINAAQRDQLKQALAEAAAAQATGIVLEIDSTGGDLEVLLEEMDALLATKIPTAAFVNAKAASAASLLPLAADRIYLHPSGFIGSSVTTGHTAESGLSSRQPALDAIVAKATAAAKAKGHPEDVAAALVDPAAEVKRSEQVLDGPSTLLSLTAEQATRKYYGHPLLASGTASDTATVARLAGFSGLPRGATSVAGATSESKPVQKIDAATGPIFVIPLDGEVGPTQSVFLRRALKEAQRAKASAVVIEVDTFGGRVDSAMEEMDALIAVKIPTYAFVNTKAISAGSMISLAAQKIYMHPSAIIGASAVVTGGGEDLSKTMSEKATSMVVAKARGTAQANGHAEDIAEAFVRTDAEVVRDGKVVDGKTTLLTLNAADAMKEYGGKPLFAAGTVASVDELIQKAGLTGKLQRFDPSGFETMAFWITSLAPLLLLGGIVGAYIEMKVPGFGIPGICSLICFALFFGGHYIAGLAGFESVIVFVIGVALVVLEIFVFPGTIVIGLCGVMFMLGALVWAMVDRWPAEGGGWAFPTGAELERPLTNLVLALVGAGVAGALLAKVLPKTSIYRRLVLLDAVPSGAGVTIPETNASVRAGETGTATTVLRPAGKAKIGDEIHDVVSTGDFIPAGSAIRVLSSEGVRIVVERAS